MALVLAQSLFSTYTALSHLPVAVKFHTQPLPLTHRYYHATLQLYNNQRPNKNVVCDNHSAPTGYSQHRKHIPINFTPPKAVIQPTVTPAHTKTELPSPNGHIPGLSSPDIKQQTSQAVTERQS
jgi:hypothetical protein